MIGELAALDNLPDVGEPLIGGGGEFSPGVPAANRAADVLSRYPGHVMSGLLSLPQRAFEASEERRAGGEYDPAPIVEAATLPMGTGSIAGVPLKGGEVALGAGIVRDPKLWSPLSDIKLAKPLSEMEHRYTDVRTPEVKYVDPASMVGGHLILTPWDLSAANKTLTHVDNTKLTYPVTLHGGQGFPEANRGLAAASELPFARPLDNLAAEYAEKGPVYIAPMTMGPMGINASHHVADPASQMAQLAKITKKDAKAFDAVMREQVPDWVGIHDPNFHFYINNLQGGMTTKALMADRMGLREWQAKGFPDMAAIRHATTEPNLIDVPRNTWGMSISEYVPGKGLIDTEHPSFSKGVAGNWMGQLARLAPYELGMPSAAEGLARVNAANKAAGKKTAIQPAYHAGKPIEGVPRAQKLTNEWLDNLMKQQEGD